MKTWLWIFTLTNLLFLAGCASSSAFKQGKKFDRSRDFDQAMQYYKQAYDSDPSNFEYRMNYERARFQAAIAHLDQARKLKATGQLEPALQEFQRAFELDPSSSLAEQEIRDTRKLMETLKEQKTTDEKLLLEMMDKSKSAQKVTLTSINNEVVTLKLTGELRKNYESIAKVGGINVIFDPDLPENKLKQTLGIDLNNVTVLDALDILALQSKTYWSAINKNTVIVAQDNTQTRQFYEEQIIKTFYLGNNISKEDLNEIVLMLQRVMAIQKFGQINSQNAIVVKDTPAKVAMVEKILRSIDKARPEVIIDVALMEVDRNFVRNLGVSPPTSTSITFNNGSTTSGGSTNTIPLSQLKNLSGDNFLLTIPTTTLNWGVSRGNGKTLQNPTLRATDGKLVKLTVGTKYPIAQSGFQPYMAGTIGGTPYVNFQYIDIGVQMEMTPHVMLNRDVSLTIKVTVNARSGEVTQSGFTQPILTQRSIEQDIRLKEGESNVIGGIIQDTDVVSVEGVAGLEKIPLLKYFFSSQKTSKDQTEIVIAITPHIVRLPDLLESDFEPITLLGSGMSPRLVQAEHKTTVPSSAEPPSAAPPAGPAPQQPPQPSGVMAQPDAGGSAAQTAPRLTFLKLLPPRPDAAVGSRFSIVTQVENAQNLFAASCSINFDPKLLRLVDVQNGGFLSSDGKLVALAPRMDNDAGQAVISISRPPESLGLAGNGSLLTLIFEAIAPGNAQINFTQGSVRDVTQTTLPASFSSTQVTLK